MAAEIKPNYDSKRAVLADIVPLETPFSFYIEPTRVCNLKCFYCMHSTRDDAEGPFQALGYDIHPMSMELFAKLVEDLKEFPDTIKRVSFSGLGEPLANRNLPQMVKMLRDTGKVERIDILTNALLLDNAFAQELIDAGVSKIIVSIQGVGEEDYLKNCQCTMKYETLLQNLTYFFKNKKEGQESFIKVIDATLKDKKEEEKFFSLFGEICDTIYIEHLTTVEQQMDSLESVVDFSKNLFNEEIITKEVCTIPFYYVSINSDGDVFHCSPPGLPREFAYGSIQKDNLRAIWNSKNKRDFLKLQCTDGKPNISWCKKCTCDVIFNKDEFLDDRRDEVLAKLNAIDE